MTHRVSCWYEMIWLYHIPSGSKHDQISASSNFLDCVRIDWISFWRWKNTKVNVNLLTKQQSIPNIVKNAPFSPVCRCDGNIPWFWLLDSQVDRLQGDAHLIVFILFHLKRVSQHMCNCTIQKQKLYKPHMPTLQWPSRLCHLFHTCQSAELWTGPSRGG